MNRLLQFRFHIVAPVLLIPLLGLGLHASNLKASEVDLHGNAKPEAPGYYEQEISLRSIQVSDRVWMFLGRGGNIGIVVTDNGVVVIDTQFENVAPAIVEQVGAITDQPIRYIINTHLHSDHVGGNAYLQNYGVVIAHQNTYERMLANWEGQGLPGKGDGLPQLTFRDQFQLNLGGIEIQLFNLGRGHTDTDVVVWIPDENVVHVGDLLFNRITPYVDTNNGAHTDLWMSFIKGVLERINPDTKVIPGHGELSNVEGLRVMAGYLLAVRQTVRRGLADGMSKEAILSLTLADLGAAFADWEGRRLEMALSAAYSEIVSDDPPLPLPDAGSGPIWR